MADVFLSYRNTPERRAYAMRLSTILRAYQISVWWDHGLAAGESYRTQVTSELAAARIVTPLWCEQSVASKWVLMESELGRDRLVPIRLQRVTPPAEFESIQSADLTEWDGSVLYPRLTAFIANICSRLDKPPTVPSDTLEELSTLPPLPRLPDLLSTSLPPPSTSGGVLETTSKNSARSQAVITSASVNIREPRQSNSPNSSRAGVAIAAAALAALAAIIAVGAAPYFWRSGLSGEPSSLQPRLSAQAEAPPVASNVKPDKASTPGGAVTPPLQAGAIAIAPPTGNSTNQIRSARPANAAAQQPIGQDTPSQAGLTIAVSRSTYKLGDDVTFQVASDRPCSFIIFTIDAARNLQCLDPATKGMSLLLGDPVLRAGETRQIPAPNAPGHLRADPPIGRYTLGVVCGPEEFKKMGYEKIVCNSLEVASSRGLTAVLDDPSGILSHLDVRGNTVDFNIVSGE